MSGGSTGFFGKIPAAGDFVGWNLPRSFTDRWDRWFSAELLARPDEGPLDPRAWRFVVPAGVFGEAPVAGVWRMSEDRAGRRYPFVIARLGPPPGPGDPWFARAEGVLAAALVGVFGARMIAANLGRMDDRVAAAPEPARIAFWIDGPEVKEVRFEDVRALARDGLRLMRDWAPEEEEL